MSRHPHHSPQLETALSPLIALVAAALVLLGPGGIRPAAAQYSDPERGFVVAPVRVPAGGDLSGAGFGCSGGGPVVITIDGQPGTLVTVIAGDDSTYSFGGVAIPPVLVVGGTYTAVASCDGVFETANFTVICASGDEPDSSGECPTPPPTTTTTTTTSVPGSTTSVPGSTTTSPPAATTAPGAPTTTAPGPGGFGDGAGDGPGDGSGGGSSGSPSTDAGGGNGGGSDLSDALAFTGSGPWPLLKIAATLATGGIMLVLTARRRDQPGALLSAAGGARGSQGAR